MANLRSFKRWLAVGIGVGIVLGATVGSAMQSVGALLGAIIGMVLGAGIAWLLAAAKDRKAKRWYRR